MKRGFTLIELLVVMFIIGLLASLVIVNVNESRKTARDTKRMADLKTIKGALEQFNNKNGYYPCANVGGVDYCGTPTTGGKWTTGTSNCGNPINYIASNGWIPGLVPDYLPVLPNDPKGGAGMCYAYMSDKKDYMLMAWQSMETVCDDTNDGKDPGDTCNTTYIREMDRPRLDKEEPSIAVYSSGATGW